VQGVGITQRKRLDCAPDRGGRGRRRLLSWVLSKEGAESGRYCAEAARRITTFSARARGAAETVGTTIRLKQEKAGEYMRRSSRCAST